MLVSKTKILIGIFAVIAVIGIIALWIMLQPVEENRIEVRGQLKTVKVATPLFNKECMDKDLIVEEYYLSGVCKKPEIVASLSATGEAEEITVRGISKKVEAVVPSEENPSVLITKTFRIIEVEEVIPPEIIIVATNTTSYKKGEKIEVHLKHYLKNSVFSHFGTEKPLCAIESIEKKATDWKALSSWAKPSDCDTIALKEIKPFHLSGEANILEWQPALEPGKYRLKIAYKLAQQGEWQTIYSNEFVILKPETSGDGIKCNVKMLFSSYDIQAKEEFLKTAVVKIDWKNYDDFSVEEITIGYGYGGGPYPVEGELALKHVSLDGRVLTSHKISDPREEHICVERLPDGSGGGCYSNFLKEGEGYIHEQLFGAIEFIELYERETLPEWAFPDTNKFEGFKPGELLLRIDLSECMKKFCEEVALPDDPSCIGEYYSPPTIIKGSITDHLGNPVDENTRIDFSEKLSDRVVKTGSTFVRKNGEFVIDKFYNDSKLYEGTYVLYIYPLDPNLKDEFIEVELKKGEIKTLEVSLKQCGSVAGKITDQHGNPITDAWVYEADRFEPPHYHVCEEMAFRECELGTFFIGNLEPGTHKIGAEVQVGEGQYVQLPPQTVQIELGKTTTINFVYEK